MGSAFEKIGDRIRLVLAHRGYTQRELSRRAGLAESQLGVILLRLRDRPFAVELETLARIAAGAEVSLAWLLTGADEVQADTPTALRDRGGWDAAVRAVGPTLPPLQPWVWTWLGDLRLPTAPPLGPNGPLLLDLVAALQRQFGDEAIFARVRAPFELPPASRRARSKPVRRKGRIP